MTPLKDSACVQYYSFHVYPSSPLSANPSDGIPEPAVKSFQRELAINCVTPAEHMRLCSRKSDNFGVVCSTGLRVYDGSAVLAEFIFRRGASFLPGHTILELGCGCGLAGIACLHFPCTTMHFTDGQPSCLAMVRSTLQFNFSRDNYTTEPTDEGRPFERWTFTRVKADGLLQASIVRASVFSWDDPATVHDFRSRNGEFDIILCAEICYFFVDLNAVTKAVATLLELESGVGIFCHANRLPNGQAKFIEATKHAGLVAAWVAGDVMPFPTSRIEGWVVAHSASAIKQWFARVADAAEVPPLNTWPGQDVEGQPENDLFGAMNLTD